MYVRQDINGTTPNDIKNLNDNLRYLWLKVFGDISFTDLSDGAKKIINSKVGTDDVHSIIQQAPEDIKIGFNGITDIVEIDENGIQVNHEDGSYTRMEGTGFVKYINGSGKMYHSLISTGTAWAENNPTVVTLPDEFKGKNFGVILSICSVSMLNGIVSMNLFLDEIDTANGTFTMHSSVGTTEFGETGRIQASYIAIA